MFLRRVRLACRFDSLNLIVSVLPLWKRLLPPGVERKLLTAAKEDDENVALKEILFRRTSFSEKQVLYLSDAVGEVNLLRYDELLHWTKAFKDSLLNEHLAKSYFISFSTQDMTFAEKLHADLVDEHLRCWFAPHSVRSGEKLHHQIYDAIQLYDRVLLVLSESSMKSEWVKTEIANARQKEIRQGKQVLFPISIVPFDTIRKWSCFDADTGKDSAREVREYFIPDFSEWTDEKSYREVFGRLLRDIKSA